MFHLDPPPNFQGFRTDLDVVFSERHLPHWRQEGATYFVTFRLADALPIEQQKIVREIRTEWESANPEPRSREQLDELVKLIGRRVEHCLDSGLGSCVLRDHGNRNLLTEVLRFFDVSKEEELREMGVVPRYELGAYTTMPNHVHLIVRPLDSTKWDLSHILQSWKRQSSKDINSLAGKAGKLWMSESHDRIVRDPQHLWRCLQYTGNNPAKAGLKVGEFSRWVRPEWVNLGWKFDDDFAKE